MRGARRRAERTRAFDGAAFYKLESVALVGVALVRTLAAAAEPPQIQPPGPVRLEAIYQDKPPAPPPPPPPAPVVPPRDESVFTKTLEAAKLAEKEFLKAQLAKAP